MNISLPGYRSSDKTYTANKAELIRPATVGLIAGSAPKAQLDSIAHIFRLAAALLIFLKACASPEGPGNSEPVGREGIPVESYAPAGDSSDISGAGGFRVTDRGLYRVLSVYNPWQGARSEIFTYILADRDKELPADIPAGTVIRTPARSVICMSTTHIAMIDLLGETASISAVSGGGLVYNQVLRDRIDNGELPDIGYDNNLDYEKILELNPDVILAYGVGAGSMAWLGRLSELGMNVVMVGEYLEKTPLEQAGWIRFIAHLFNRQEMADSIFAGIENRYAELAHIAATAETAPVVMSGLPWRGSWFVPGGRSHFASLVSDAGGRYLWEDNRGRENFPVDIESVISRGRQADYWINTGTAQSAGDILRTDSRLGSLPPLAAGNIYNNNARTNRYGGNDYWESGIVNPHIILADLVSIFHRKLLPDHEQVYYRKLE